MSSQDNMMISTSDFKPSTDFKYVKPKINKSGGKSVGILNAKTNKALYLTTPLMLTWGVNENDFDGTGKKSYDMSLQFPKEEYETPETKKFLDAMVEFQDKLKADAVENSKEWLAKGKITPEVVDALFSPMLRYPKDPNTGEPDLTRAPTLRIKLDYWDNEFNCEIYDMEHKPLFPTTDGGDVGPMDLIPKATNVALVIRCGGIWFANGKFGCTWRLMQALVKPKESLKGRCFIKLSQDDANKLKQQESAAEEDEDVVGVEVAEDSDEEEEQPSFAEKPKSKAEPEPEPEPEPEEEEPEPAPKPVKKRKVVRKKAAA